MNYKIITVVVSVFLAGCQNPSQNRSDAPAGIYDLTSTNTAIVPGDINEDAGALSACGADENTNCYRIGLLLSENHLLAPNTRFRTRYFSVLMNDGRDWIMETTYGGRGNDPLIFTRVEPKNNIAQKIEFADPSKYQRKAAYVSSLSNDLTRPIRFRRGVLIEEFEKDGWNYLRVAVSRSKGDLGGGVFNQKGQLLGVIVHNPFDNELEGDIRYAISAEDIKREAAKAFSDFDAP